MDKGQHSSELTETEISSQIKKYLEMRGFTVWRNNTVARQTIDGRWLRNGLKGSPDLIGWTPEGYFLGIEVKRPGKKLSLWQQEFKTKLEETKHGKYIIATCIDDVQKELEGFDNQLPF